MLTNAHRGRPKGSAGRPSAPPHPRKRPSPDAVPLTEEEEAALVRMQLYRVFDFCDDFRAPDTLRSIACTFVKRFFLTSSVMEFFPPHVRAAAMWLACKVDEHLVGRGLHRQCSFFGVEREHVVDLEPVLVQGLRCHLVVHTPHKALAALMQELRSHLKLGPDPAEAEAIMLVPRGKDEGDDGAEAAYEEDERGEEQDPAFSLYGVAPDSKLSALLESAREQLKCLALTDAEFLYSPAQARPAPPLHLDPTDPPPFAQVALAALVMGNAELGHPFHLHGFIELIAGEEGFHKLTEVVDRCTAMASALPSREADDARKIELMGQLMRCMNQANDVRSASFKAHAAASSIAAPGAALLLAGGSQSGALDDGAAAAVAASAVSADGGTAASSAVAVAVAVADAGQPSKRRRHR